MVNSFLLSCSGFSAVGPDLACLISSDHALLQHSEKKGQSQRFDEHDDVEYFDVTRVYKKGPVSDAASQPRTHTATENNSKVEIERGRRKERSQFPFAALHTVARQTDRESELIVALCPVCLRGRIFVLRALEASMLGMSRAGLPNGMTPNSLRMSS